MLGFCRHKYAPLGTIILFAGKQGTLEQCTLCEKLRGRYSDVSVAE